MALLGRLVIRDMLVFGKRRPVIGRCCETGEPIAMYAQMTDRELRRLKWELHVWCPQCRRPHHLTKEALSLAQDPL